MTRSYTNWTPELDEELVDLIDRQKLSFDTAGKTMGKGGKALQSRYRKLGRLHPDVMSAWTQSEDEKMLDLRFAGNTWPQVSVKMPRKQSAKACAARFHRMKRSVGSFIPHLTQKPSEPRKFSFEK